MIVVPENQKFRFRDLCPYCGGNMVYEANGWTRKDDEEHWMADVIEGHCDTMPDPSDEDKWEEWEAEHSLMPYVYRLPVDVAVQEWINKRFRFQLKNK